MKKNLDKGKTSPCSILSVENGNKRQYNSIKWDGPIEVITTQLGVQIKPHRTGNSSTSSIQTRNLTTKTEDARQSATNVMIRNRCK